MQIIRENFAGITYEKDTSAIWFNILVLDIKETFSKAISAGCTEVQPVTELSDYGVSNAIFSDAFGYQMDAASIAQRSEF